MQHSGGMFFTVCILVDIIHTSDLAGLEYDGRLGRCTLCTTSWMKLSNLQRHEKQVRHQELLARYHEEPAIEEHTNGARLCATVEDYYEPDEDDFYTTTAHPISGSSHTSAHDMSSLAQGFLDALLSADNLAGVETLDQAEVALNEALSGLPMFEAALLPSEDEAPSFMDDLPAANNDDENEHFSVHGLFSKGILYVLW